MREDNKVLECMFGFSRGARCFFCFFNHMGVSKNSGTPKWMVYNGKPY